MARPVTIQDDAILEAARALFLDRGMRATTAEIAERARVSPGIIFKRFKTKEALFRAAMEPRTSRDPALPIDLDARLGTGSVEDTLVDLGMGLVEKFFDFIPTMMMAWSHRPEDASGQPVQRPPEAAGERASKRMQRVAAYLAAEAKLGRIREHDFETVAQTFIGALWHHAFLQVMRGGARKAPTAHRAYIRGVGPRVDLLAAGILHVQHAAVGGHRQVEGHRVHADGGREARAHLPLGHRGGRGRGAHAARTRRPGVRADRPRVAERA
jgi:AcrR family transcriptional regulator